MNDYVAKLVSKGIRHPPYMLRELNRVYNQRFRKSVVSSRGVDVIDEDWDTLFILDGCRYDLFAEEADLPGSLEVKSSKAAWTLAFLQENFTGKDLLDSVYVSGNPIFNKFYSQDNCRFHAIIDCWADDGWNTKHGTVLPETVNEHARRAAVDYPNKRLIIHYMQPHIPFINTSTSFDKQRADARQSEDHGWRALRQGKFNPTPDDVWDAYSDNLQVVLPAVEELLSELEGKHVVTADHGNLIGERSYPIPIRDWGHPPGCYTDEVLRVPWLEYQNGPRRTICAEEPSDTTDHLEQSIEDRLKELGYV